MADKCAVYPLDVIVVGNVGIDTNIYFAGDKIDFNVEANFTRNVDYVGQAGGYCSRGFAQLGKKTAFIGYVGDDFMGQFIRRELAGDGIDLRGLFVDPAGTSRSINFMFSDGRRKNYYDGKSHMSLKPDLALCREILAQTALVHFHLPNWARHLLPIARELGATVSVDLQDMLSVEDPYRRDFIDGANILFFSAVNFTAPGDTVKKLLDRNPQQIIVAGLGERGCALGTKNGVHFFDRIEAGAPVIDTNGAGDALAVGFLASYVLDDYNLSDAIKRGQIAARHTCGQKATTSHLITRRELDRGFALA